MRFMTMVKSSETSGPPPKAGVMVEIGGLHPSAKGALIRVSGGKLSVIDGPFTETKELVGGYAVYDVKSKAEAVEWTRRFMELHREHGKGWEGETEIRQLFDASDFAAAPCS